MLSIIRAELRFTLLIRIANVYRVVVTISKTASKILHKFCTLSPCF